jgi:peptidoglycan-N-acetylglucosamine deacetylase
MTANPDPNAHVICVTIDVDAYSPVLFDGGGDAAALSQGEFDVRIGVPRLVDLLAAYDVMGTFFVPGHTAACFPEAVGLISGAGHEIGHHGYLHEPPARLTRQEEEASLDRGLESLARHGIRPEGYRAPLWEPSAHTLELLEARGFAYDSSMMATDFIPYRPRVGDVIDEHGATFGRHAALVELPASWIFDDWSYFANVWRAGGGGPAPPSHVLEIWTEMIAYAADSVPGAAVVITLHPQVSAQGYVLRLLTRLFTQLRAAGAEFVTMREAARRAAERLPAAAAPAEI